MSKQHKTAHRSHSAISDLTFTATAQPLGHRTKYIYDGNRVIQERNGVMGDNTPQVSYTRGLDLGATLEGAGGIGGLLARSSGYSSGNWTTNHFYHADGNGNITYLEDSSQAMAAAYRYDPFGNTISSSGTMAAANVYRFSSREQHAGSGFYVYLYRFYDSGSERWINRDPLGEHGFEQLRRRVSPAPDRSARGEMLAGPNLFEFVANDPTGSVDIKGTQFVKILIKRLVPRLLPKDELGGNWIPPSCTSKPTHCKDAQGNPSGQICHYDCVSGHYQDEAGVPYSFDLAQSANQACPSSQEAATWSGIQGQGTY